MPYSRVFQLWKDVSDHICQLGNYVVHNFQFDAKKLEFRKGNPFPAIFLKIIKGKHGFYNGRKIEKGPVKSRDHEVSEQLRLRLPNQTTDRRFVSEKDT